MRIASLPVIIASALFAASLAQGQEVERKMRIYDCDFLTVMKEDMPGPDLRHVPSPADAPPAPDVEAGEDDSISPQMLRDMITYNIDPDSWDNSNNKIEFQEGKLVVVQTPAVLDEIERMLDVLRNAKIRLVNVQAWALLVENAYLHDFLAKASASATGPLVTDEDAAYFLGKLPDQGLVRIAGRASVTCFSGQRVHAGPLKKTAYIRDVDVEVAQRMSISDPVMGFILTGFIMDVRPSAVGPGDSILMDLRISHATCSNPDAQIESGSGPINTPQREIVSVESTVMVPKDQGILFAAAHPSMAGYSVVFLVRPRLISSEKKDAEGKKGDVPKRILRIYDVRLLVSRIRHYPGPEIEFIYGSEAGAGPGFSEPVAEGVGMDPQELVEMIKTGIEEDSWANVRNSISSVGTSLIVVQEPSVHGRIEEFLKSLWSRRAVMIFSSVRYFSTDAETLRKLAPSAGSALTLETKEIDAIDKELKRGKSLRLGRTAFTTSFNRQRSNLISMRQTSVIGDIDVEVADTAGIGDPIVRVVSDGLAFDLLPSLGGDGKHVMYTFKSQAVKMTDPIVVKLEPHLKNVVHRFDVTYENLQTCITIPDGGAVLFILGPTDGDMSRITAALVSARIVRVQ